MNREDLQLLACPSCRSTLEEDGDGAALRCAGCRSRFPVREGVPDLLPWGEGQPGPEWKEWKDRLEKLQEWRRQTWTGAPASAARQKVADDLAAGFFTFARVPESGVVLEIGCGTGGLRRYIPRRRYIGIDPLAAGIGEDGGGGRNEAPPPVLIRGVGEKLPVGDAAIRSVILCETLDHTRDPERVLDEAWRVLEKDGVLAVMQSVRLSLPPPPLRVRIRAALGSLRRARGAGRTITDAETKTHPLTQDGLKDLVNRRFVVESGAVRDSVMFLRALRQDPAAPRVPKRNVR